MHSHPTAEHLETDAMYYKISERYYWDQMYRDVQNYVCSCKVYQKRGKSKRKEPFHPIQVGRAFEHIEIDLVRVWRLREVVKVSPPKRQIDSSNPTGDVLELNLCFGNCGE